MKKDSLFPQPYLPVGSKGPSVTVLQIILLTLGYGVNKMTPNGIYDQKTANAVKAFQSEYSIGVDGDFGPESRKMLFDATGLDVNSLFLKSIKGKNVLPASDVPPQ